MRLLLTLRPERNFPRWAVGKHSIQSMIYYHLRGTEYEDINDRPGFKFFCFSDLFPGGDFRREKPKNLLISSPDEAFIETLYERLSGVEKVVLGRYTLTVEKLKKFRLKPRSTFATGSPVVVRAPEGAGRYFTFHEHGDVEYFRERLKENALSKYRAFTGEDFELEGPLFRKMVPKVRRNGWIDVYVRVSVRGKHFDVPGSNWERLEVDLNDNNRDFYAFLMDAGLGVLNSLGFGFLNPLRE
ncbi:CRISPR-associated endoribonuclease Cas6 [Thermococcus henrietii]|uniref:CRISPR-associated endoribonuclease Cas6 n=1 Tax=Thermococcus henrietii TaxID=2016361 RepID=UPI000C07AAB5|nr:CRISPR-associated endoribonuclease Cas6 [Thermococcus henrietii]